MEQSKSQREFYRALMKHFWNHQLVFVDETHSTPANFRRKYGYGYHCLSAFSILYGTAHGIGKSASGIAAMDSHGVFSASIVTDETVDNDKFLQVLKEEILPKMNAYPHPRSVLVLDNAPTHSHIIVADECAKCGIVCIFLPPYSYDFSPIELVFHEAKEYVRSKFGLSTSNTSDMLLEGLLSTNNDHAIKYFHHCGYNNNYYN
jgi:transposase